MLFLQKLIVKRFLVSSQLESVQGYWSTILSAEADRVRSATARCSRVFEAAEA